MASTTSQYFPLATEFPCTGNDCDGPTSGRGSGVDTAAGAAGSEPGAVGISKGAMTAIIVVVSVIGVLGISMAVLFYVAKKREWKIRESIRKSARKMVTALTPRRSEFPKSVKESSSKSRRNHTRIADGPTPLDRTDIEKGLKADVQKKSSGRLGQSGR